MTFVLVQAAAAVSLLLAVAAAFVFARLCARRHPPGEE